MSSKIDRYTNLWEIRKAIYDKAITEIFNKQKEDNAMSLTGDIYQGAAQSAGVRNVGVKHAECQCEQCKPEPTTALKAKADTDNWVHRSSGMQCHTCMWYINKSGGKGRCRRHAPTLGGWPVLFPTDWCGDHKLA